LAIWLVNAWQKWFQLAYLDHFYRLYRAWCMTFTLA
jgi:hypothetical protein